MSADKKDLQTSTPKDIDTFLKKAAMFPVAHAGNNPGRLLFALDATASREPTWDQACQIQEQMFTQTEGLGGLDVQLCFYRGFSEFQKSPWLSNSVELLKYMHQVHCIGGETQIKRVLKHALNETKKQRVQAVVFVGDCVEENVDELCQIAGELALYGLPLFLFHEGHNPVAAQAFQQMANITHGAYCPFDRASAQQLADLLGAVAVYAAGGNAALEDFNRQKGKTVLKLTHSNS